MLPPTLTFTREQLVDEFGELSREQQVWAPKEKRLSALRPVIVSWFPDLAATETAIAAGTKYDIQISAKSIKKTWKSMDAVKKAAGGIKGLLALCSVTFKALADVIGNSAAEALQVESQTGYRTLEAVQRLAPAEELPKAA